MSIFPLSIWFQAYHFRQRQLRKLSLPTQRIHGHPCHTSWVGALSRFRAGWNSETVKCWDRCDLNSFPKPKVIWHGAMKPLRDISQGCKYQTANHSSESNREISEFLLYTDLASWQALRSSREWSSLSQCHRESRLYFDGSSLEPLERTWSALPRSWGRRRWSQP